MACLLLAGCGFEPLYGENELATATEERLAQISVNPIEDRVGQLVRIALTNRLTPTRPAPRPQYTLRVTLNESKTSLAVEKDSSATRANLTLLASFVLVVNGSGERLTTGSVRSVNSYDIVDSDYATLAAESDARRRGATDIADGIVDRLAIFMSSAGFAPEAGRGR